MSVNEPESMEIDDNQCKENGFSEEQGNDSNSASQDMIISNVTSNSESHDSFFSKSNDNSQSEENGNKMEIKENDNELDTQENKNDIDSDSRDGIEKVEITPNDDSNTEKDQSSDKDPFSDKNTTDETSVNENCSDETKAQNSEQEDNLKKEKEEPSMKDEDEIIELPVVKKPAEVVDLSDDDSPEAAKESTDTNDNDLNSKDKENGPTLKLKSFASLLAEEPSAEDKKPSLLKSGSEVAIGDIVEHGDFVGSDESGVMHLKISNVVGGEDCITGILAENDDSFPPIQIASVSSLIDPISPENPEPIIGDEKDDDKQKKEEGEGGEEKKTDSKKKTEESSKSSLRNIRISTSVVV